MLFYLRKQNVMASPEEPQLKSKKPSSSAFKQQKLPAWQPILTAGTVLPTFFIIGLAFIPLGIGLLISSNKVQEFQYDYTNCRNSKNISQTCDSLAVNKQSCTCNTFFNITNIFEKNVFMYYGLTNYYQNHRRYVKSRDDSQLYGNVKDKPSTDCDPFGIDPATGGFYAPCGAIANSMFNDVIRLFRYNGHPREGNRDIVPLLAEGIAWSTDKKVKFRNPQPQNDLEKAFNGTVKPPNWTKPVWQLEKKNPQNNGFQNEELIVWMRTAALPTFRKLYRRVNHEQSLYKNGLPPGMYELEIEYNYVVTPFKGTKRVILSNTSWLGGKNPFLGVAYITVGCICLVLAVVFLVIHFKYGKSTQDLVNISQKTPY